jgi:hypothetical protein
VAGVVGAVVGLVIAPTQVAIPLRSWGEGAPEDLHLLGVVDRNLPVYATLDMAGQTTAISRTTAGAIMQGLAPSQA